MSVCKLRCLFCENIISFKDGQLLDFKSHLEFEHEVFFRNELIIALSFLTDKEIQVLASKMKGRMDYFLEHGELVVNDQELFGKEVNIPSTTVHDIFTISDEDGGQSDMQQIKEIFFDDTDDEENVSTDENNKDMENIVKDVNSIERKLKEELHSSNEEENIEDFNSTDNITIKPCRIMIKKMVTSETINSDACNGSIEDEDLYSEQELILQSVSCKMEIGENEVEVKEDNLVSALDLNSINLVDKFRSLNQCRLCFSSFSDNAKLLSHEEAVHQNDKEALNLSFFTLKDLVHSCNMCPQVPGFLTENILNAHKKSQHRVEIRKTTVKCKVCQKIVKYYSLRAHMFIHNETDKKFKCKLCYTGFVKLGYLKSHQKIHKSDQQAFEHVISDDDLKFRCIECEQMFLSEDILSYHVNKTHKDKQFEELRVSAFDVEEKKYKCKLCYSEFKHFSSLHAHILQSHKKDKMLLKETILDEDLKHTCDDCEQKFSTESLLEYHKSKVHMKKEKFVRCKICSKVVKKCSFAGHRLTHTNVKNYECKLCYVKFKTVRSLKDHQKNVHKSVIEKEFLFNGTGDFKFSCTLCEKRFLTENLFQSHLRMHESKQRNQQFEFLRKESFYEYENIFKCKLCYTKFKFFSHFLNHVTTLHKDETELMQRKIEENELVFNCTECDYKFVSKQSLEYHSFKGHNLDSSTTNCKLCDIHFKRNIGFMLHRIKIHKLELSAFKKPYDEKDRTFGCETCGKKCFTQISINHHMARFHGKPLKCKNASNSGKKLKIGKKLTIKVKSENQERYCQLCYLMYKEPKFLKKHKDKIHSSELDAFEKDLKEDDMQNRCSKCDKSFYSQNTLEYHMQRKHRLSSVITEFSCNLCYIYFSCNSALKRHLKDIHRDDMHLFDCQLDESLLTHQCQICEKKFISEQILKYHVKNQHKGIKERFSYCKLCYVTFKFPSHFKMHKSEKHKEDLWAFQMDIDSTMLKHDCSHCDLKFLSEKLLKYHENWKHKVKGVKEISSYCKLCYVTFKFPSHLKMHKSEKHKEDMWAFQVDIDSTMLKHDCPHCDLKFLSEKLLKYHANSNHKELKENISYCNLCYIDYKKNALLKAHRKNVHTTKEEIEAFNVKLERTSLEHKCKFCKKRFLTKHILKYHNTYQHKEERRQDLSCEYCNKVFTWKKGRDRVFSNHMRTVHNVQGYQVDEQESVKENETVKNFMSLLNSLQKQ